MSCEICSTSENLVQPICCKKTKSICRECIDKVDKCPFCRNPRNDLRWYINLLIEEIQERMKLEKNALLTLESKFLEWELGVKSGDCISGRTYIYNGDRFILEGSAEYLSMID